MSLINCPECSKEVSNKAATCPNCGFAIASQEETKGAGTHLTTIQETSKKLKSHQLESIALAIGGLVWFFSINPTNNSNNPTTVQWIAFTLFLLGLGWFLITEVRIWWHHK